MPQQKPTIIPARHHQNSRVLTMLPRSSKIRGYKGVITYVHIRQEKLLERLLYSYFKFPWRNFCCLNDKSLQHIAGVIFLYFCVPSKP